MVATRWIGAVCEPALAGGTTAHLDATILSTLDECRSGADLVCTQIDRSATIATVTVTARVPADIDITAAGTAINFASQAPAAGTIGRCIRFPGQRDLTGIRSVAEIVASSEIDEVIVIGGTATPDALVDTRDHLRPEYQDAKLVLLVEPAAGGLLRPVEIAQPHQCCGGH